MKNKIARAATYILSFAACIWLFKLAYSGQDFSQMQRYIRQMDLFWVGMVVVSSLICHTARSLRWQLLLRACHLEMPFWRLFLSLMSGYFVNQALPRIGELVRCYLVKRSDNVGYGTSIGSVVAERAIDTFCLFLLLAGTFFVLNDMSYSFFVAHIKLPVKSLLSGLPLYKMAGMFFLVVALLVLAYLYYNRHGALLAKRKDLAGKAYGFTTEIIKGTLAVMRLKSKGLFLLYTAIIWSMYFSMTYFWFFSLSETLHLGIQEAFFIWAIGSIGRMVPVQGGGAGAYHYLVIQAFLLFGVSASVAGAMALVIHGLQTVIYVLVGSFSLLGYLLVFNKPAIITTPEKARLA